VSASLPALLVLCGLLLAFAFSVVPRAAAAVAGAAVAALLVLTLVQSMGDGFRRPPFREAAGYVDRVAAPDDSVVEVPPALVRDQRLPAKTLDRYFDRPHRLFRSNVDDQPAWAELRNGRSVFVVTPRALLPSDFVRTQSPSGERIPDDALQRLDKLGGPDGRAILRSEKSFAGIFPVAVLRYAGMADGRLKRRGGRELLSWSLGREIVVSPGAARGAVEAVTEQPRQLMVGGWALARGAPRPVDWILTLSGKRLIAAAAGGTRLPGFAPSRGPRVPLADFGFAVSPRPSESSGIRVLAVVGKRASELPLSPEARAALR
jgi:hypothetical protein